MTTVTITFELPEGADPGLRSRFVVFEDGTQVDLAEGEPFAAEPLTEEEIEARLPTGADLDRWTLS
jgi:hypothetical protein